MFINFENNPSVNQIMIDNPFGPFLVQKLPSSKSSKELVTREPNTKDIKKITEKIFSFLDLQGLARASRTCKSWFYFTANERRAYKNCYETISQILWKKAQTRFYYASTVQINPLKHYAIIFKRPYSWEKIKEEIQSLITQKDSNVSEWATEWLKKIEEMKQIHHLLLEFYSQQQLADVCLDLEELSEKAQSFSLEEIDTLLSLENPIEAKMMHLLKNMQLYVESLSSTLKDQLQQEQLVPSRSLNKECRKVLETMRSHWEELTVFLEWPDVSLSAHTVFVKILGIGETTEKDNTIDPSLLFKKEVERLTAKINNPSTKGVFIILENTSIKIESIESAHTQNSIKIQQVTPTSIKIETQEIGYSPASDYAEKISKKHKSINVKNGQATNLGLTFTHSTDQIASIERAPSNDSATTKTLEEPRLSYIVTKATNEYNKLKEEEKKKAEINTAMEKAKSNSSLFQVLKIFFRLNSDNN